MHGTRCRLYSLDPYQTVDQIEPVGTCVRQLPFSDHSQPKPDKIIREYRVDVHLHYEPGDRPITFDVSSAGKGLRLWQAYASYWLTGGFVLYGYCGKEFMIDKVFGKPQANPSHFGEPHSPDDAATFDPEGAPESGKKQMDLGYTYVRKP